jgi:hypothetical protein
MKLVCGVALISMKLLARNSISCGYKTSRDTDFYNFNNLINSGLANESAALCKSGYSGPEFSLLPQNS